LGTWVIVADTNLIIYLLIDSEQTPFAEQCGKRDPFWVAPAVWRHELINALSQHVRLRGLAMDDAMAALATADGLIETVTLRGLDEQIMRWSADHGLAGYDAEFAVAAELLDVRLITADKALIRECNGRAVSPRDFAAGTT
jgi:predicted nucleic acid-binding protein